jgi:hypothetical protein
MDLGLNINAPGVDVRFLGAIVKYGFTDCREVSLAVSHAPRDEITSRLVITTAILLTMKHILDHIVNSKQSHLGSFYASILCWNSFLPTPQLRFPIASGLTEGE